MPSPFGPENRTVCSKEPRSIPEICISSPGAPCIGEMEVIVGIPASETLAIPDTVAAATVVAVTVTKVSVGMLLGAV
jgi:hypothetical protein